MGLTLLYLGCVIIRCRANLSKALVVTARRWAAVVAPEEADRLTPVVESLSQRCVVALVATCCANGFSG